jgi:acetyl esterase/lipase
MIGRITVAFNRMRSLIFAMTVLSSSFVFAQDAPFIQHQNIVYAEVYGIGLIMDVFVPTGDKNGLGIIDVISGAWHSDRSKIRDHARGQMFHILCGKGYTVFAVRPGSVTKFSAHEMRANLNQGIRWVKEHSKEYGVDPDRLGLMGASAGGHLASFTALTSEEGSTAGFFPPTDFLTYTKKVVEPEAAEKFKKLTHRLAFTEAPKDPTDDEMTEALKKISPAQLVTSKAPPFLLIHGNADIVVPLQQSEVLLAALKGAGVPAELVVKEGGGHAWLTMHEEVGQIGELVNFLGHFFHFVAGLACLSDIS